MSKEGPVLVTDRLIIRAATVEDARAIIDYYTDNQAHFAPWLPRFSPGFYRLEYWEEEIRRNQIAFEEDRALKLYMFEKAHPDRIIGNISFTNFVRGVGHYCNLGYNLAEEAQGKGYMTEALRAALRYVFDDLHMHRVMAAYIPHNQRSATVLKRLGFTVEGYARDYLYINGRWQDHLLTGLINYNWKAE